MPEVVTWYIPLHQGPGCDVASPDWDRRWNEFLSDSTTTVQLCRYAAVRIGVES